MTGRRKRAVARDDGGPTRTRLRNGRQPARIPRVSSWFRPAPEERPSGPGGRDRCGEYDGVGRTSSSQPWRTRPTAARMRSHRCTLTAAGGVLAFNANSTGPDPFATTPTPHSSPSRGGEGLRCEFFSRRGCAPDPRAPGHATLRHPFAGIASSRRLRYRDVPHVHELSRSRLAPEHYDSAVVNAWSSRMRQSDRAWSRSTGAQAGRESAPGDHLHGQLGSRFLRQPVARIAPGKPYYSGHPTIQSAPGAQRLRRIEG